TVPIMLAQEGEEEEQDREAEQDRDDEPSFLRGTRQASSRGASWYAARRKAVALIGLAAVGISAAAWLFRPIGPQFECPVSGPTGLNFVLVHLQTELPDTVRETVSAALEGTIVATAVNALLEVRILDGLSPGGQVLFSGCRP